MTKEELKKRFFEWTISILDILQKLPSNEESLVIRHQLIKSCTSSSANYRAACRAKSSNDMINKLKIVEEELDESMFWLEIIHNRFPKIELRNESKEANELLSIIISSIITLKKNQVG
jgi:four helix bundle protein